MQLHEFYERTLPPSGVYTLFTVGNTTNYWFDSLGEMVAKTEELADRPDCYFGVAGFKEHGTDKLGRTQANVASLKCFKLDLDAGEKKLATQGPDKVYATQRDALMAIVEFTKQTGLAFSILVSSGEGLHVYYELDEPVTPEQWRPVAKQFQEFGKSHGLKIDSSVTADHSRVLRPIGTLHPNGKRVEVLKSLATTYTLADFAKAVGHVQAPKYDASINDDLLPADPAPKSFKKIMLRCAAMERAYTEQESIEEPYWRAAIGICKHTVEGLSAAQAISSKHPEYDEDQLIEKFERWETGPSLCSTFRDFAAEQCGNCKHWGKIKSPIVLGGMSDDEVEQLPVELKPEPPKQSDHTGKPWDGCLPEGFDVIEHKAGPLLVHKTKVEKVDEDGNVQSVPVTVGITYDIFWFGQWTDAHDTDDTAQVVVHKMDRHIKRNYLMEQTLVASRADLTKYLASKGIHLTADKRAATSLEVYAKAQVMRIKNTLQRPKITDRFGLRITEEGNLVASQGQYLIHGDGRIEQAMLGKVLRGEASRYGIPLPESEDEQWDRSVWKTHIMPSAKAHVEFMRRYYAHEGFEKYQLAIMMGLCSPLMAFVADGYRKGSTLPPNGLSVALFSENGGKGKTTAMRCSQLAFGHPAGLNRDNDDLNTTALARIQQFSTSGTMPVNMDEMGDLEAKTLATLIRTIANGNGRTRLHKDGSTNASSPWALICLIGTNKSQREIISVVRKESSAEQFRLLELNVENMPKFGVDAQDAFERDWKTMGQHAGALGAVIHLLICKAGVDKINTLVSDKVSMAARLVQEVKEESASRFQYRALGAMLALNELLAQVNLAPFSEAGLVREFLIAYKQACEFVDENVAPTDSIDTLSRMLMDLQPYTIITMDETRRSGFKQQFDQDVRGRAPLIAKARHVVSDRITYVSTDAVREWCHEHKIREANVVGVAKNNDILVRIRAGDMRPTDAESGKPSTKRWASRFNLFKGMKENPGGIGVQCYCFNVGKLSQLTGEDYTAKVAEPVTNGKVIQLSDHAPDSGPTEETAENAA